MTNPVAYLAFAWSLVAVAALALALARVFARPRPDRHVPPVPHVAPQSSRRRPWQIERVDTLAGLRSTY